MSTMFRIKYKLGFVSSAKKIDTDWAELTSLREELHSIENSSELKRFQELKKLTASYDFQLQKKEIQNLRFQESQEKSLLDELKGLEKNKNIRDYFKILESEELVKAKQIKTSPELGQYLKLKEEVASPDFQNRKKGNPDLDKFRQLSKKKEIIFYQKFINSSSYKNYLSTKGSFELERFDELKKITSDPAFKEQVIYLKNKNRYETTELFRQEKELKMLEKSSLMKRYDQLKKSSRLNFFKEWSVVFEEDFNKKVLDKTRWQTENYWGYKLNGQSFSQADEAQCYNGERNIHINGNSLSILTRAEKMKGQSWNVNVGLMPKEFEYTSGIINSADSFRFKEGIVEAKVKFKAAECITNAFSLTGSMPMPQIDVFRSGKNCVAFGYSGNTGNGISKKYKQIFGLDFNQYHVFRLEKFDHTLAWKINGETVHTDYFQGEDIDLFLNFVTSLHEPVNRELIPHHFEIDWIRCYAKKN